MAKFFSGAACVQWAIHTADPAANLSELTRLLASGRVPPCSLVVLPELWSCGFVMEALAAMVHQTRAMEDGLQQLAKTYQVVFAGSLPQAGPDGYRNVLVFIGPAGVLGRIGKRHLFHPWQEDRLFVPGERAAPVATPWGLLGGLVCYDLRFPELAREQCALGCQVLVVSGQWPASRITHWRWLLRARAVENQVFVVGANGCGLEAGNPMGGCSLIVAPDGAILAQGDQTPGVVQTSWDVEQFSASRSRFCCPGERLYAGADADKIVPLEGLQDQLAAIRHQRSTLVFTNGCFDILHPGHVAYLEAARIQGDWLVVGLNTDRSVRRLKGASRPVNRAEDRARVLAALGCVDRVVLFEDLTPLAVILALRPDVLVKGADWDEEEIVGGREVRSWGGRVVRIPLTRDHSTTRLIERIKRI